MSNETKNIIAAMVKAWATIGTVGHDAKNPGFKRGGEASGYASLQHILETVRPILSANGLWVAHINSPSEGGVCVTTRLFHESGETLDLGTMSVPADKQSAQAFGSAMTYARRYGLLAALGIVTDEIDDDGKAATLQPTQSDTELTVRVRILKRVREWGFGDDEVKAIVTKAKAHTKAPNSVVGWQAVESFLAGYDAQTVMDFLNTGGSAAATMNNATERVAGGEA